MAFKLSPELSDGVSHSIVRTKEQVLELVGEWCDHSEYYAPGESCQIEYVEMSDAEIEALPDL